MQFKFQLKKYNSNFNWKNTLDSSIKKCTWNINWKIQLKFQLKKCNCISILKFQLKKCTWHFNWKNAPEISIEKFNWNFNWKNAPEISIEKMHLKFQLKNATDIMTFKFRLKKSNSNFNSKNEISISIAKMQLKFLTVKTMKSEYKINVHWSIFDIFFSGPMGIKNLYLQLPPFLWFFSGSARALIIVTFQITQKKLKKNKEKCFFFLFFRKYWKSL